MWYLQLHTIESYKIERENNQIILEFFVIHWDVYNPYTDYCIFLIFHATTVKMRICWKIASIERKDGYMKIAFTLIVYHEHSQT